MSRNSLAKMISEGIMVFMVGKLGNSRQVLGMLAPGQTVQRIQRRILLFVGLLALLLFWWSGWDWWPTVVYAVVPMLVVILPGVRRLIDESYGLILGLVLAVFVLMPETPGALVTVAWGVAIGAVAGTAVRRRQRGWRKWLPLAALAVAAVLIVVGGIVWWVGARDRAAAARIAAEQAHDYTVSTLLPSSPRSAVIGLVEGVAIPEKAARVCTAFSPTARAQFALAHRATTCEGALATLRTQIRSWGDYVNNVWVPAQDNEKSLSPADQAKAMDACHLEFTNMISGGDPGAGPQIGLLVLEQQYGNGWLITDYKPCP